jgi:hypothetical protein
MIRDIVRDDAMYLLNDCILCVILSHLFDNALCRTDLLVRDKLHVSKPTS